MNDRAPAPAPHHRFRGLRAQMVRSFLLLSIPVLILLEVIGLVGIPFTTWRGFLGVETDQALRHVALIADIKKERLLRWIAEREGDARLITDNRRIAAQVARLRTPRKAPGDPGRDIDDREVHDALDLVRRANGLYTRIEIIDLRDGAVLVSTREGMGAASGRQDWLKTVLPAPGDAASAMAIDAEGDRHVLRVFHRLADPGGQLASAGGTAVVLTVDTEIPFAPLLHAGEGLGERGEAMLFDDSLAILTGLKHPLPDGSSARPLQYHLRMPPALRAVAGQEGVMETLDYRGREVLAAYRHLPFTGGRDWGLVVQIDRGELLGFLDNEIRRAVLSGLFTLGLLLAMTLWMAGRLSRPIVQLGQAAEAFSRGDMTVRSGVRADNEIGLLASTFDRMAATTQQTLAGLEEQTRQLHAALDQQARHQAVQERILGFSRTLVAIHSLEDLYTRGLDGVMQDTDSQAGALYLRDEDDPEQFKLVHAVGLAADALRPRIQGREGGFGLAIQRKSLQVLADIPPDTLFLHPTLAGAAVPKAIVHLPLVFQERVLGVLALASLRVPARETLEILTMAQSLFSMALADALSHARTEQLADKLRFNNTELEANNQELQAQSLQLRAQTEELQSQAEELRQQARELERKQEQVSRADRLKTEFLSNMSHELRTPLNSVLTLSRLMLAKGVGHHPQKDLEYLQVIERNGQQLLDLINDILDLSKIESGQMELVMTTLDPAQAVTRAAETIRPLAETKGLVLEVHIEDGMPAVLTDGEKVRQILLNLLSNAVKFTRRGQVEIGLSRNLDRLVFWVRDTGIGIAAEHQDLIFEAFTQVDGSASRHHEGTGLGLAISRKLADLLGASLLVQSSPGAGTTFTLTLPLQSAVAASPAPRPAAVREPPVAARPLPESARILVVEDNEVARLQIRTALEETGHRVVETPGGREALEQLDRGPLPDLVLLDLMMPGMDGFQMVARMRARPETARIPVLILTAKALTPVERSQLVRHDVQALIQKGSLNRDQLLANIRGLLNGPAPSMMAPAAPGSRSGPAILAVEDKPDNLLVLTALLDELPHPYLTAVDGWEAVEKARRFRPGLILMDMQLPVLNGFDATRQIREDPLLKDTPIIAVTASAMQGDRERMLAAGCDDYISKPIDPARLTALVNQWLPAGHV
ncbi:MAG: response regulator [Magnetococcales bacterium]|nr:response regulator [Magnetococcales bacterium]